MVLEVKMPVFAMGLHCRSTCWLASEAIQSFVNNCTDICCQPLQVSCHSV